MRKSKLFSKIWSAVLAVAVTATSIVPVASFDKPQTVSAAVQEETTVTQEATKDNETMMQGFEWFTVGDGTYWNTLGNQAKELSKIGITSIWLPPAYKGASGTSSAGYDPYDLYDLGEFAQKSSNVARTKYGTKDEYLAAIKKLHNNNIAVYADAVMNHKSGADSTETVNAYKVNWSNRLSKVSDKLSIEAWTVFDFKGRNNKYSSFKWDASCFDGVDWDQKKQTNALYLFSNKEWDKTSTENGNYDFLMGADTDLNSTKVRNELVNWGAWYYDFANLDGYRIDAVKHMEYSFVGDWITRVNEKTGKKMFAVAEYLDGNVAHLKEYIDATDGKTTLFDFPMFYRLRDASKGYNKDLRNIFKGSLIEADADHAVTFVDNHDMQAGRSGDTVSGWFKPNAYAYILTRKEGIPCVFYCDYYGSKNGKTISCKEALDSLLFARKYFAYGTQHTYSSSNGYVIGWTREGDSTHKNSGLATVISSSTSDSSLTMNVGKAHAGEKWIDVTGNSSETVTISSTGSAKFKAVAKKSCVYVNENRVKTLMAVGKASGLKVSGLGATSVKLAWNKVSGANGYHIYKYNTSAKKWDYVANSTKAEALVKNLNQAAGYRFKVLPYKKIGNKKIMGSSSNELVVVTRPVAPSLKATAGTGKCKLEWKKPCARIKGYEIYMSTSKNGTYKKINSMSAAATAKVVQNLTKNKTYYFKIRTYRYKGSKASDGIVYSGFSSIVSVKIK